MTMNDRAIVLASGSPRRLELVTTLGIPFSVVTSGVDEEVKGDLEPMAMVIQLAERKARAVATTIERGIVIGADTTVAIDGEILNKPIDDADARRMLRRLRGRTHAVWTGLATIDLGNGASERTAVRSVVHMRDYADEEIDAYVATGESLDKAGAYAIQGGAGLFVRRIEGCYANVVGLPLCELAAMLRRNGLPIPANPPVCTLPDGTPCPRLANAGTTADSHNSRY
jgi:septum formation protein